MRTRADSSACLAACRDLSIQMRRLSDDELVSLARESAHYPDLLPQTIAAVREIAGRWIGDYPFDTQILGTLAVLDGCIAEMKTGEGKTLSAAMAALILALRGHKVYVVTVNDYLARRDADWMSPLHRACGMTVGAITSSLTIGERAAEYSRDIVYASDHEMVFDFLSDRLAMSPQGIVQGELDTAIIDEVDSILIDEAQTPLIRSRSDEAVVREAPRADMIARRMISEQREIIAGMIENIGDDRHDEIARILRADPRNEEVTRMLAKSDRLAERVRRSLTRFSPISSAAEWADDFLYLVDEQSGSVILTRKGYNRFTDLIVRDSSAARKHSLYRCVVQSLRAHLLFRRDVEYMVNEGRIIVVDEYTGRPFPDKRFEGGLHPALEAKERLPIKPDQVPRDRMTYPAFFRRFRRLAGLTGTASQNRDEFRRLYGLEVIKIPTNKPVIRVELPDRIYQTHSEKVESIVSEVAEFHRFGVPILVGTRSVAASEELHSRLAEVGIKSNLLNARNHAAEAEIVAKAGYPDQVTIATNMAGRGTDIRLHPRLFDIVTRRYVDHALSCLECGESLRLETFSQFEFDFLCSFLNRLEVAFHRDDEKQWVTLGDGANRKSIRFHLGLYVIGTERHEAARIDEQLIGRCGRQGDPGVAAFFLSLEDDLLRIHGAGDRSRDLSARISRAQAHAEDRAYSARIGEIRFENAICPFRERYYGRRQRLLESRSVDDLNVPGIVERMLADGLPSDAGSFLMTRDEFDRFALTIEERLNLIVRTRGTNAHPLLVEELLSCYSDQWTEFLISADQLMINRSIQPPDIFEPNSEIAIQLLDLFNDLMSEAESEFIRRICHLSMPTHRRVLSEKDLQGKP